MKNGAMIETKGKQTTIAKPTMMIIAAKIINADNMILISTAGTKKSQPV